MDTKAVCDQLEYGEAYSLENIGFGQYDSLGDVDIGLQSAVFSGKLDLPILSKAIPLPYVASH